MHLDKRGRRHQPREKLLVKPTESTESHENSVKCESVAGRTVTQEGLCVAQSPQVAPNCKEVGCSLDRQD